MIDKNKIYRTRDGREVRIYAVDGKGAWPVHGAIRRDDGWNLRMWHGCGSARLDDSKSPNDLIVADPHGILPRHRELLAEELDNANWHSRAESVRNAPFSDLTSASKAALIALARIDAERYTLKGDE